MSRKKAKRPPFGQKSRAATPKQNISLFGLRVTLSPLTWQLCLLALPLVLLTILAAGTVMGLGLLVQNSLLRGSGSSLALALLSAAVTSLLAFPCTYLLAFKISPMVRRWMVLLLSIPFVTGYLLRAYDWQMLLNEGVSNGLLGVLVGHLTLTLPLVVVLQLVGLTKVDRSLIEVARNLGCRPLGVLLQVILPVAGGWIVIAALAGFILAFGDFMAPQYLGASNVSWPNAAQFG